MDNDFINKANRQAMWLSRSIEIKYLINKKWTTKLLKDKVIISHNVFLLFDY